MGKIRIVLDKPHHEREMRWLNNAIELALKDTADWFAEEIRTSIEGGKHIDTGEMLESVEVRNGPEDLEFIVSVGVPYYIFFEKGRKPGRSPPSAGAISRIQAWLAGKGLPASVGAAKKKYADINSVAWEAHGYFDAAVEQIKPMFSLFLRERLKSTPR